MAGPTIAAAGAAPANWTTRAIATVALCFAINMADGIAVFDAPVDEGQSKWVIDAAKAKYLGKPIKYLVLTHHHMDHTGGTRAYVAEGATVVTGGASSRAYFFFASSTQAENACSLTARTAIGIKA